MSDHRSVPHPSRVRDRGLTLPELLIVISVLGLIGVVLCGTIVVTMRQEDSTRGRLNVAYAEQSVGLWLPADLASADTVTTAPEASPCGASVCDGIDLSTGSNVLMLTWTTELPGGGSVTTSVSYHFRPSNDGAYELLRVECVGGSCSSLVVLRDLPGPPGGEPFTPGVPNGANCAPNGPVACTRPDWVIIVSEPLDPDAISEDDVVDPNDPGAGSVIKDANRVIVTINGGGDGAGAGGGLNQISITAGGTVRSTIDASSTQGAPSFVEARSLCGGPMTLIVDESNSIGGAITDVKAGVRAFIEALAGTPVKLQIVGFHTYSHVLGAGSGEWHKYFDMTNESDVATLLAQVDTLKGSWSGNNGGTNWEEGLFRTFYNADGSTPQVQPQTVVFFTDGVPTFDRLVHLTSPGVLPAQPPAPGAPWPDSTGSSYSQVAFNRANFIANKARKSVRRMIGVGVGSGISGNSQWMTDPGAGYRTVWERGYRQYYRYDGAYQSNLDFERGSNFQSRQDFEQATSNWRSRQDFERGAYTSTVNFQVRSTSSGSWQPATPTQYVNWTPTSSTYRRINGTRSAYTVTAAEYYAYRNTYGSSSNWAVSWSDVTPTVYYSGNTTSNENDGYRINGDRSSYYNVTQAEFGEYSDASPSDWTATWTDIGPSAYYAGEAGGTPGLFRINGTRGWYTVTSTEHYQYSGASSSNWSATWTNITPTEYHASNTTPSDWIDSYRINGTRSWTTVTATEFNTYNTTNDESDGYRAGTTWITKAEYDAGNTTPDWTDGYIDVGTPEYVSSSSATDWVVWTGSRPGDSNQYRSTRVYNSPPYEAYEPAVTNSVPNSQILSSLITGTPTGVPANWNGTSYDNTDLANMYVLPQWSQFPAAMEAVALGECGGTLTIQTKVGGTTPASDPFRYQTSAMADSTGTAVVGFEPSVVTTNQQFVTGTFDYPVPNGEFITVDILPQNYSELKTYTPGAWSCRAGVTARPVELIPIADAPGWNGIRIKVAANEAVSCTLSVTR